MSLEQYHIYKSGWKHLSEEKFKHKAIMEWYFSKYPHTLDLWCRDLMNHIISVVSQRKFFLFLEAYYSDLSL